MRKILFGIALVAVIAFAAAPLFAKGGGKGGGGGGGDKAASGQMSVQVRSEVVHSTPNYLGASVGTVSYATQVNVLGEQGNWYQIDKPAGWIPKSALTQHKVAVNPDQKFSGKGQSHDEVALAGKGFEKVESQYRGQHPELSQAFEALNRIDNLKIPEASLRQFQKSGKLTPR